MKSIAENIQIVEDDIARFVQLYDRAPSSTLLIAASKTQTAERVAQAYQAGLRHFGENYLQEALEKQSQLTDKAITWHFIGPIQSRKAKDIAVNFDWVHSVDRLSVAQKLSKHRPENLPPLQICIQVNISNDPNKSGVAVDEIHSLSEQIAALPGLELRGLMTLPKAEPALQQQRLVFRQLVAQFEQQQKYFPQMDTLSMGMSQDLEAAIAEGATFVRIGTAIFGPRS